MPGSVIGINLQNGFPGTLARSGDEVSRTRAVKSTSTDIPFGAPVVLNTDGTVSKFAATNVAADFCGVAIRKIKQSYSYLNDTNFGSYKPLDACDVLERGSISIVCPTGTPVIGGQVYIIAATGEWTATAGSNISVPGIKFVTTKDANNVCEIALTERKGV